MLIYICDDKEKDRELLKKYIFTYASEKNIEFTIYECSSGEELLTQFSASRTEPTILFLDIFMEQLSGIDAACHLRQNTFSGGLIFTTYSRDYAIEGFNLGADGYLCKPYEYEQFTFFFKRCINRLDASFKKLTILSNRKEFHILLHQIEYIETCTHGCFLRCGRSFIVNINAVSTVIANENFIHLKNGNQILIPVRERNKINSQIADFHWKKLRDTDSFSE